MTALLCEEYQWSNYSYIGRPRRRPVLIFHRLPRERSERAPKSTANNGSSEPPLRHAPRGLSEQTAKHWLSPRRAENRDKMIKNCQAGLAITRSAVSPRQDKSLRFFSSLLSLSVFRIHSALVLLLWKLKQVHKCNLTCRMYKLV